MVINAGPYQASPPPSPEMLGYDIRRRIKLGNKGNLVSMSELAWLPAWSLARTVMAGAKDWKCRNTISIFNNIVYNTTVTMASHAQYQLSGQASYGHDITISLRCERQDSPSCQTCPSVPIHMSACQERAVQTSGASRADLPLLKSAKSSSPFRERVKPPAQGEIKSHIYRGPATAPNRSVSGSGDWLLSEKCSGLPHRAKVTLSDALRFGAG